MKYLILALTIVLAIQANAQDVFETFMASGVEYKIKVSSKMPAKFIIETTSTDDRASGHRIELPFFKTDKFKQSIGKAAQIYFKWKKTAETNKVTDLNKVIKSTVIRLCADFRYGDSRYGACNQLIQYRYSTYSNISYFVLTFKYKTPSQNRFISSNPPRLEFSTKKEIVDFMDKLDVDKAKAFLESNKNKDDLFKQ